MTEGMRPVSYKVQQIVIRLIIIAVIAGIGLGILFGVILKPKGYTGQEWYEKQTEYLDEMETFASTLDGVITMYVTEAIGDEDLLSYVQMLRSELDVMVHAYDTDLKEHPLEAGTVSNNDIIAANSVRDCYDVFYEILDMIETNYGDAARMRYLYLGYHQIFNEAASGYFYVKLLDYYDSLDDQETQDSTDEQSASSDASES